MSASRNPIKSRWVRMSSGSGSAISPRVSRTIPTHLAIRHVGSEAEAGYTGMIAPANSATAFSSTTSSRSRAPNSSPSCAMSWYSAFDNCRLPRYSPTLPLNNPTRPTVNFLACHGWLNQVRAKRLVPSVTTTSRIDPLRFCIRRWLTRSTRAMTVTCSSSANEAKSVSSPRSA